MKLIDNRDVRDPYLNLALEEYAVRNLTGEDPYVLFYVNSPSIIVGKNQNTLEEINHEYVRDSGLPVVRRISGGGTVYHDFGNLNFSFLEPYETGRVMKFEMFVEPVVRVLRELGVPAELTGRNDILAAGRKISGNAQFFTAKRMFSHGTLLFDSELERVVEALNVKMTKIESKGLKSVRSRVANISEFTPESLDMDTFRRHIREGVVGTDHELIEFDGAAWAEIEELARSKYRTWDWNFGRSPAFNIQKAERFSFGEIDARIDVKKGVVEDIAFYGDFFGQRDVGELADHLRGVRYERDDLSDRLELFDVDACIHGATSELLVEFLY